MKNGNFFKHFLVIGSGTLINMALSVFTTPIITRIVDPVEYGQLSIFTMYSGIALMVLCMGLDQAIIRFYYEESTLIYKRALLLKCIKIPIISSVIISFGVIFLSAMGWYNFEFSTTILVWLCVFTVLQIIYRFSLLIVRLEYNSKMYSFLNVLHKLLYILIILPLLALVKSDYLLILVIGTTLSIGICMAVSIWKQSSVWSFYQCEENDCFVGIQELMKYAAPFIISMGVGTLFQAIDKIALNYYCTYYEVGIYASTMMLVQVFAIIQSTFNTLWAPLQVEHYTKNPDDHTLYQKGNQIITVVMFFMGITLILCKDIFAILLGEQYRAASYILPFLIFNPIMSTISETTVGGIVFFKKSSRHIIVAVGACITNIIGNILLVPEFGGQGAAISTGIAYIVFFSLRTYLSNQLYYTNFKLKQFYLLTIVVSVYAFYNTFYDFSVITISGYIVCIGILGGLYFKTVKWGIGYLKVLFFNKLQ